LKYSLWNGCKVLVSDKTLFINKKSENWNVDEIPEGANLKIRGNEYD
jgi:hypothetical protein